MVIWKSEITNEMVSELSQDEIEQLIENLNDVVQEVAESFGVK
jgi:hypothetical protein